MERRIETDGKRKKSKGRKWFVTGHAPARETYDHARHEGAYCYEMVQGMIRP